MFYVMLRSGNYKEFETELEMYKFLYEDCDEKVDFYGKLPE